MAALFAVSTSTFAAENHGPPQPWSKYFVHDMDRPAPPVVTPGEAGKPPSDAIVLFDGSNVDAFETTKHAPAPWTIDDGAMIATKTSIVSKQAFGDIQLHVEFQTPPSNGKPGQERNNSGVFLMNLFEVQVLDSYQSPTYPDGQCGALYGQFPPMVNVCKPPEQWQLYDIVFHHAKFDGDTLKEPANITVIQNGVLVQDHQELKGPTGHMIVAEYKTALPDTGPLGLQFHGNPMRFRNIWVRPLEALAVQQHTGALPDTGAALAK